MTGSSRARRQAAPFEAPAIEPVDAGDASLAPCTEEIHFAFGPESFKLAILPPAQWERDRLIVHLGGDFVSRIVPKRLASPVASVVFVPGHQKEPCVFAWGANWGIHYWMNS